MTDVFLNTYMDTHPETTISRGSDRMSLNGTNKKE